MTWRPIGDINTPFKGHFDGNGKTISNLVIKQPSVAKLGLFGCITGSEIKNLRIQGSTITGEKQVGTVVGFCLNSKISNILAVGNINIDASEISGCIVGEALSTKIENCQVSPDAILFKKGSINGGIAGSIKMASQIAKSSVKLATKTLNGTSSVGGIVGKSDNSSISDFENSTLDKAFLNRSITPALSNFSAFLKTVVFVFVSTVILLFSFLY